MYLFYDIETINPENPPTRIVKLAFQVYSSEYKMYKSFCQLIKPNGWEFPKSQKDQNEISMQEGFPIEKVLNTFKQELEDCKFLISHRENLKLFLISEYNIMGMPKFENKPKNLCVSELGKSFFGEALTASATKALTTSVKPLHELLFGCWIDKALQNDLSSIVTATAKCFFAMKRKNLI